MRISLVHRKLSVYWRGVRMEWFDCTEKGEKRVFEKLVSSHFETGNPLILKNFTHAIRPRTKAGVFYNK